MMTKKQKAWLWVFIAMFAVPEIIWGPVLGYTSFVKNIFMVENRGWLLLILFVQTIGALLASILFAQSKINLAIKIVLSATFSVLFILALYIFVLLAMTANINIG